MIWWIRVTFHPRDLVDPRNLPLTADARFGERRRRRWTFHPRDLVAQPSIRVDCWRCGVAGLAGASVLRAFQLCSAASSRRGLRALQARRCSFADVAALGTGGSADLRAAAADLGTGGAAAVRTAAGNAGAGRGITRAELARRCSFAGPGARRICARPGARRGRRSWRGGFARGRVRGEAEQSYCARLQ
jgi:hypothetical protein